MCQKDAWGHIQEDPGKGRGLARSRYTHHIVGLIGVIFPPSRTKDRPSLLPLPTMGVVRFENHPGPVENRKLDDIYTTLNELVSELKYSIQRKLYQCGRFFRWLTWLFK